MHLPFEIILPILFLQLTACQQCRLRMPINQLVVPSSLNKTGSTMSSAPSSTSTPSNTTGKTNRFRYGTDMVRGVNLGGWFVLEPWITPSLFEGHNDIIIDEYTFGQEQSPAKALATLDAHWSTWIVEDDFQAIAAAGINHVRIPLGFWSVPITSAQTKFSTTVTPYIRGAWPYFIRALNWASNHGIRVIVDLHGAPGSQNGFDNSGQRIYPPKWAENPDNVARTIDILKYIVSNTAGMIDVIELLNEPAAFYNDHWAAVVKQFWTDGYDAIREETQTDVQIMIGDGFLGVQSWEGFLTRPTGAYDVLMDYHEYQIFSNEELSRSFQEHIDFACSLIPNLRSFASQNLYTILGEWSPAPTDCAKWLNGYGTGSRWDGTLSYSPKQIFGSCTNYTGSAEGFSNDYQAFLRKYWEVQVAIGETLQGWVMWTWKAEQADEWSYQAGLKYGWIPRNPTDLKYPKICG